MDKAGAKAPGSRTRALRSPPATVFDLQRLQARVALDFRSEITSAVLGEAYAATRRGGTTTTVGLPDPTQILEIPAVSLVAEERTLRGSYLGSSVPARDLPRFIDLYRQGRLDVERLLTDRLALDDINEGFDRLASGAAVRQAIVFD